MPEDLFAYNDDADVASETMSLSRTIGTESDGSSMHMPDSTCTFRHSTLVGFAINNPNAEAFGPLQHFLGMLSDYASTYTVRRPLSVVWAVWLLMKQLYLAVAKVCDSVAEGKLG